MAEQKRTTTAASKASVRKEPVVKKTSLPLFYKENYLWMGIGIAVIAIGMMLMAGGKNADSTKFDYNVVYSTRRVTIAPILIIVGLLIEIYAIFKKPKLQQQ